MSKKRRITVAAVVLCSVGIVVGALIWRLGSSRGPGRQLVGVWEVGGSEFEDAAREAIGKQAPEAVWAVGDKFKSTERIHFDRSGSFHHVQDLLDVHITSEGTWEVTEPNRGTLAVKLRRTKVSVRDQKGQTRELAQDAVITWVVSVVGPDRLSATLTTDDGKSQKFPLRRVPD
jgi:hypothetical protein